MQSTAFALPISASGTDKKRILQMLKEGFERKAAAETARQTAYLLDDTGDSIRARDLLDEADRHFESMLSRFETALRLAGEAYQVLPAQPNGQVHGGPMNGLPIAWRAVVQLEAVDVLERESPDGRKWYFRSAFPPGADGKYGEVAGHTFHSGDVRVAIDILEMARDHEDPGVIALSLYHEAVHFEDLASRGFRGTFEDLELRAYTETQKHASKLIGTSPHDPNWHEKWVDHVKSQRDSFRDKVARHEATPGVPTEEGNEARKEEFDTQQARLAQIRREEEMIRERAAEQEREREEAHRRTLRAQPLAGADPVVRMRPLAAFDSFGALKGLTQRACANPGSILQEEITRWFSWIPNGSDYSDQLPGDLEGCPHQLLTELLDYNSSGEGGTGLNPSWLNGRARELQPRRADPFPLAGGAPPPALSPAPAPPRLTNPPRQRDCDRFTKDGITWVEVNCP